MAKGGKTNQQMKSMGRNLAKVANQKRSYMPFTPVQKFAPPKKG